MLDPSILAPPPANVDAPGWIPVDDDVSVPNPVIVPTETEYVMFATQTLFEGITFNVPYWFSPDLVSWSIPGDALPVLPPWAEPGHTWAPDVLATETGWVLYFTARLEGTELQCIGHAAADSLIGPYTAAAEPLVCPTERGGAIDPRTFVHTDGTTWLLWKSDDNWDLTVTDPTTIFSHRLDATGTTLEAGPHALLTADGGWEGHIVEAPDMVSGPDGRLWLLYSGGWFNQPTYGLGLAVCDTPAGPCHRHGTDRFLGSNDQGAGPGEASVWTDRDGSVWLAYSPWAQRYRSYTPRPFAIARLGFDATGPYLADPRRGEP